MVKDYILYGFNPLKFIEPYLMSQDINQLMYTGECSAVG